MEVTTLSTKGQIIIPEKLRAGYDVGSSFLVSKIDELIVLKPIKDLSIEEKKEISQLNKIWKEIDSGKVETYSEKEFFKAMKKW